MRTALLATLLGLFSCDSFLEANPIYCDADRPCTDAGMSCNLSRHRCEASGNSDMGSGPDPRLISISPAVGPWAGGTDVLVNGANFAPGMTVQLNGAPVATRFVSAEELHFTTPTGGGVCGGKAVTVKNAAGQTVTGSASLHYQLSSFSFAPRTMTLTTASGAASLVSLELSATPDDLPDFLVAVNNVPSIVRVVSSNGVYMINSHGSQAYTDVQLEDFDGNGIPDAIFSSPTVFDIFQDSNVTNSTPLSFVMAHTALAFGDANSDRFPDLFVFDSANRIVQRRLFSGPGFGFGLYDTALMTGGPGATLATADLDGDGKIDVTAGVSTGELDIALGLGGVDGSFVAQGPIAVAPSPALMQPLDVDGDGKMELIIASEQAGGGKLSLLKTQGPTFAVSVITDIPPNAKQMFLKDMNCDGAIDIVLYRSGTSQLDIYLADGAGAFSNLPTSVDIKNQAVSMLIVPLGNVGGRPDVALLDSSGTLIFVDNTSH